MPGAEGIGRMDAELVAELLRCNAPRVSISDPFPENYFERPARPASVLVPLVQESDGWHLLFIRRATAEGDRHSGQVAFPGGRQEPEDDSPEHTALRETAEEIGIHLDADSILGRLNSYRTISNYLVTPVVARLPWPAQVIPDEREVSHIFTIPLSWLDDERNRYQKERPLPGYPDRILVHYFKPYADELLWGITAKITVSLLQALNQPR